MSVKYPYHSAQQEKISFPSEQIYGYTVFESVRAGGYARENVLIGINVAVGNFSNVNVSSVSSGSCAVDISYLSDEIRVVLVVSTAISNSSISHQVSAIRLSFKAAFLKSCHTDFRSLIRDRLRGKPQINKRAQLQTRWQH